MRVMNLLNSNCKKVRGAGRKSRQMLWEVQALTAVFPEVDWEEGFWHMHLPVPQSFIDSAKTPFGVRRLCAQALIDAVEHLRTIKPKLDIPIRVTALITLPRLWDSQIIIFFGESYFAGFFNRNNDYQKWAPLPEGRNLANEWQLRVPENLTVKGYREEITDDGDTYVSQLWYIGEL